MGWIVLATLLVLFLLQLLWLRTVQKRSFAPPGAGPAAFPADPDPDPPPQGLDF